MRSIVIALALSALVIGPADADMRLVPASAPVRPKYMPKAVPKPPKVVRRGRRLAPRPPEPTVPTLDPQFCTPDGACRLSWQAVSDDIASFGTPPRFDTDFDRAKGPLRTVMRVGPDDGPGDGSRWTVQAMFDGAILSELWLYAPVATRFVPSGRERRGGGTPRGLAEHSAQIAKQWNSQFAPQISTYVPHMEVSKRSEPQMFYRIPLGDYVMTGGRGRLRDRIRIWRNQLGALPSFIRTNDPTALPAVVVSPQPAPLPKLK